MLLPLSVFFLFACSPPEGDSADNSVELYGQLELSFSLDEDQQDRMDESPIGAFTGSFYRASDVTVLGPNNDAEDLGDIFVEEVDLRLGNTEVLFSSADLPVDAVVVLGFLDSDSNRDLDEPDPDHKDPVTLPGENTFLVVAGTTTEAVVHFGFLKP